MHENMGWIVVLLLLGPLAGFAAAARLRKPSSWRRSLLAASVSGVPVAWVAGGITLWWARCFDCHPARVWELAVLWGCFTLAGLVVGAAVGGLLLGVRAGYKAIT